MTPGHVREACRDATAAGTDAAVRGHPLVARQGAYQGVVPGARSVIGSDIRRQLDYLHHPEYPDPETLDVVRWPTEAQPRQGIDR